MANWRDLATENYGAAGMLLAAEHWRSAVSRAYFAAYARATAALFDQGVVMPQALEGPSHTRLPGLIVNNVPKLGIHRRVPVSRRVRGLYHLRLMADYRPSIPVEKRDATLAAGMMAEVFRRLKEAY